MHEPQQRKVELEFIASSSPQKAFENWNNLLPNLDKQFFDFIKDD